MTRRRVFPHQNQSKREKPYTQVLTPIMESNITRTLNELVGIFPSEQAHQEAEAFIKRTMRNCLLLAYSKANAPTESRYGRRYPRTPNERISKELDASLNLLLRRGQVVVDAPLKEQLAHVLFALATDCLEEAYDLLHHPVRSV